MNRLLEIVWQMMKKIRTLTILSKFLTKTDFGSMSIKEIWEAFCSRGTTEKIGFGKFFKLCKVVGFRYLKIRKYNQPDTFQKYQLNYFVNQVLKFLLDDNSLVLFFDVSSISDNSFKDKAWSMPGKQVCIGRKFTHCFIILAER